MGLFNTEYRCTCKQCSHVWHYTKSDEKEQKSLQKQAKGLQIEEAGRLITPFSSQKKAMQNLQRQQLVQSQTKELDRCPNCGSRKIKKEDSAFAPKITSPQVQAQIQPEPQTPVQQTPTPQVQQTPPPPLPQTQAPYALPQRPTQSVGLHVVLFLFTVGIGNIIYFLYIKNKQQQYDMSQSR